MGKQGYSQPKPAPSCNGNWHGGAHAKYRYLLRTMIVVYIIVGLCACYDNELLHEREIQVYMHDRKVAGIRERNYTYTELIQRRSTQAPSNLTASSSAVFGSNLQRFVKTFMMSFRFDFSFKGANSPNERKNSMNHPSGGMLNLPSV